jgi:hypothetical protein
VRSSEFIIEAFDSEVPYEVTRSTNDLFTTKADINNRTIVFNAQGNDEGNGLESSIVWEVDFYERSPGNMTFGKSGSGGEMKVFSFIIDSLKELNARYNPQIIRFGSYRDDGNRTKLYQRMIAKIAPRIGYKLSDVKSSASDDVFVLTSIQENFADGKKPGRKGLAKRSGVNCKQSISKLRQVAKNSSGEKQRMAHWCANMKSGKKK